MKTPPFKSIFATFFIAVCLTTFSCKENHHEDPHPKNDATITISSPKEHSSVAAQDSVHITGTITATQTLHGYTIFVRRKSDNKELFKKEFHVHSTNITIDQKCLLNNPASARQALELEVVTALDHAGNTASKKAEFQCTL